MSESSKNGAKKTGIVALGILLALVIIIVILSAGFGLAFGTCNAIGVTFNVPRLKENTLSYIGVTCYGWVLIPLSIVGLAAGIFGIVKGYQWIRKSYIDADNNANGYKKLDESERKGDISVETKAQEEPSE